MLTLSRIYPVPDGVGSLTGTTGGLRYGVSEGMLNIGGLLGTDGRFCGTGGSSGNFNAIKASLGQFLQSWNAANGAANQADRVIGVVDAAISNGSAAGLRRGHGRDQLERGMDPRRPRGDRRAVAERARGCSRAQPHVRPGAGRTRTDAGPRRPVQQVPLAERLRRPASTEPQLQHPAAHGSRRRPNGDDVHRRGEQQQHPARAARLGVPDLPPRWGDERRVPHAERSGRLRGGRRGRPAVRHLRRHGRHGRRHERPRVVLQHRHAADSAERGVAISARLSQRRIRSSPTSACRPSPRIRPTRTTTTATRPMPAWRSSPAPSTSRPPRRASSCGTGRRGAARSCTRAIGPRLRSSTASTSRARPTGRSTSPMTWNRATLRPRSARTAGGWPGPPSFRPRSRRSSIRVAPIDDAGRGHRPDRRRSGR